MHRTSLVLKNPFMYVFKGFLQEIRLLKFNCKFNKEKESLKFNILLKVVLTLLINFLNIDFLDDLLILVRLIYV